MAFVTDQEGPKLVHPHEWFSFRTTARMALDVLDVVVIVRSANKVNLVSILRDNDASDRSCQLSCPTFQADAYDVKVSRINRTRGI